MALITEGDNRLPAWLNKMLNAWPFLINTDSISTWALARDAEGWYSPGTQSLMYNGYVFFRASWPFGVFLGLKWKNDRRFQCGIGYKLNGRIGVIFRYQTDADAAAGVQGPNYGQATGFERGTA